MKKAFGVVVLGLLCGSCAFARYGSDIQAVPQQLIVKLKPHAAMESARIHRTLGAKVAAPFKLFRSFQVVTLPKGMSTANASDIYAKSGLFEYVEPNFIYHAIDAQPDPLFTEQWALSNTGQTGGTAGADISALKAWGLAKGDRRVIVAVIDTGVDYKNPELAPNLWRNAGEIAGDGIDNDGNGFVDDVYGWNFYSKTNDPNDHGTNDPMDDHFHGTHCAGVIGAAHDGRGTMGVAAAVSIMGVKFLGAGGGGTLEAAIKATEYAILNKADILSNSWGGDGYSRAFAEVIEEANRRGILYVAAAGNDHNNNDSQPTYPASYTNANVIAVAASDNKDEQASFTNWGANSVHLFAPGVKVLSTVLDSKYKAYSGTSMACPHVAGAAAVLKSHLGASHLEVKERLLTTVDKHARMSDLVKSGGRLNLYNALTNTIPPPPTEGGEWVEKPAQVASPHPYPPLANLRFTIEEPGAKAIKVHFSRLSTENRNDFVALTNEEGKLVETLTGNQGALWSRVVSGSKVTIIVRSDSLNQDFGFEVDRISILR